MFFPEKSKQKLVKVRENTVVEFLTQKFPEWDWVLDTRLATTFGGCCKRRPDALVDFGEWVLIVEVDENKHQGYSCEERRELEILETLGRPVYFLRFNPDHKRAWKRTKSGVLTMNHPRTWERMLFVLEENIRKLSTIKSMDKDLTRLELFYE